MYGTIETKEGHYSFFYFNGSFRVCTTWNSFLWFDSLHEMNEHVCNNSNNFNFA